MSRAYSQGHVLSPPPFLSSRTYFRGHVPHTHTHTNINLPPFFLSFFPGVRSEKLKEEKAAAGSGKKSQKKAALNVGKSGGSAGLDDFVYDDAGESCFVYCVLMEAGWAGVEEPVGYFGGRVRWRGMGEEPGLLGELFLRSPFCRAVEFLSGQLAVGWLPCLCLCVPQCAGWFCPASIALYEWKSWFSGQ